MGSSLRRRLAALLRPWPLAAVAGGGCLLLVGLDAWRHGGRPGFAAPWLAVAIWAGIGLASGWLLAGRWHRHWRQLALLAVTTLLCLLAVELLLPRLAPERGVPRLRGVRSRWLHHALPPSSTLFAGRYDPTGRPVLVRTNADGLRSDYERDGFLAHGIRVAVVGDSFAFGWGVQAADAWPARLEGSLRQQLGTDLAVLNAGIFSYSPLLERRQWQHVVAAYRPQLVIQLLDASDVGDDCKYAGELGADPDGPFPWPDQYRLGWRGALVELARPALDALRPALLYPARVLRNATGAGASYYAFRLEVGGVVETNRFFIYRHPLRLTRPYFEASWRHVGELADLVRASGAEHMVLVLPRFHHWNSREAPDNWEAGEYRLDEPHAEAMFDFYRERAAVAAFPVVDLLPAFRDTTRFPLVFRQDPHLDENGNAFLAEVVTPLVAARLRAGGAAASPAPAPPG